MRTISPGDIVVLEGHGIERYFLGENVVTGCMQAGGQAIVVDGGARDFLEIQTLGFPLFCRFPAILPRTSVLEIVDVNVPIFCAGAQVWPGDVVVGDNDGVISIPLEALDNVLKMLTVITECEHEQRRIIKKNLPIEKMAEVSARKRSGRSVLG
jgi:4-hydroxy-4-methyl-2-oxoglutarate aldolase